MSNALGELAYRDLLSSAHLGHRPHSSRPQPHMGVAEIFHVYRKGVISRQVSQARLTCAS